MIYIPRRDYAPDIEKVVLNLIALVDDWTQRKLITWEPGNACTEILFEAQLGQGKDKNNVEIRLSYQDFSLFIGSRPKIERFSLRICEGVISIFEMRSDESSYDTLAKLFHNVYKQVVAKNPNKLQFSMHDFNWTDLERINWKISKKKIQEEARKTSASELEKAEKYVREKETELTNRYQRQGFTIIE